MSGLQLQVVRSVRSGDEPFDAPAQVNHNFARRRHCLPGDRREPERSRRLGDDTTMFLTKFHAGARETRKIPETPAVLCSCAIDW